jgi:hypothetical protein
MRNLLSLLILASAALAAGSGLHAGDSALGVGLGAVVPVGGARQWLGSTTGSALDILDSFDVGRADSLRMRLGFFHLKAPATISQTVAFPGIPAAAYPYASSNELFAFTYGVDYLHPLARTTYALGGLGLGYFTAATKGDLDLSAQGFGKVRALYDANGIAPYACLGAGVKLTPSLALEARYQLSFVRGQQRPMTIKGSGPKDGVATFDRISAGTLTFGVVGSF